MAAFLGNKGEYDGSFWYAWAEQATKANRHEVETNGMMEAA